MALNHPITTLADFEAFIQRPENSEKVLEFISGKIVEVPTNHTASKVAARILLLIGMYLLKHDIGHLSGADHGFDVIANERYALDVGYISYETMPQSSTEWFTPHPPEMAVEVVSADRADENKSSRLKCRTIWRRAQWYGWCAISSGTSKFTRRGSPLTFCAAGTPSAVLRFCQVYPSTLTIYSR